MPVCVANIVKAPRRVIAEMLGEGNCVDFRCILPLEFDWPWQNVQFFAEVKARAVIAARFPEKAVMYRRTAIFAREFAWFELSFEQEVENLMRNSLDFADLRAGLTDEEFEQMTKMLENFDACGNLHVIDFTREKWGTPWNAGLSFVDRRAGVAYFYTAWDCPRRFLEALSKKFPNDRIRVHFADQYTGHNCGCFTLKGGTYIDSDIAPPRMQQTPSERTEYGVFAIAVYWAVKLRCEYTPGGGRRSPKSAEANFPELVVTPRELMAGGSVVERWEKRSDESLPAPVFSPAPGDQSWCTDWFVRKAEGE